MISSLNPMDFRRRAAATGQPQQTAAQAPYQPATQAQDFRGLAAQSSTTNAPVSGIIPKNVGMGMAAQAPTLPSGFTPQGLGFLGALLNAGPLAAVNNPVLGGVYNPVGSAGFDQLRTAIANRLMQNGFGSMMGFPMGWGFMPRFMPMPMMLPYFRNFDMPYQRKPIPDIFID